jgi:hypothetical protein
MRPIIIYVFFTLVCTNTFSQTKIDSSLSSSLLFNKQEEFTVLHTSNQEKIYGETKTSNLDTNRYIISLLQVADTNQVVFHMTLLSFSTRVNVAYGTTPLVNYYYSTRKKLKNDKYQIAFDNFDATVGNLVGKKIQVVYDKKKDSLIVQNADSIVNSIKDIPSGLLESVRSYFSNDYFSGFFNVFLRTGVKTNEVSGRKWTRLQEKETLGMMPNFADKSFTALAVKKDSILVSVSGVSTYRNPSWTTRYENKNYGSGVFDGLLTMKPSQYLPYNVSLNFQFKFPKSRYSEFDEVVKTKTKITFIKNQK